MPVLTRLEWNGETARLVPRIPLTPGLSYVVVFEGPRVARGLPRLVREYHPAIDPRPSTAAVSAIYPRDGVVPANLLKLYLCFTVPMAGGDLFRHVLLRDAAGSRSRTRCGKSSSGTRSTGVPRSGSPPAARSARRNRPEAHGRPTDISP